MNIINWVRRNEDKPRPVNFPLYVCNGDTVIAPDGYSITVTQAETIGTPEELGRWISQRRGT